MNSYEVNFDGLIGPTHNYSGLSYGNTASLKFQKMISNPKKAALQGLEKMKYLMDLGIKQAVLPPHERPHLPTLRDLGFTGSSEEMIRSAFKNAPDIFYACCSASSMWSANAATVSPSCDSMDGLMHITPANLLSKFHRSIETSFTAKVLLKIFSDSNCFMHHAPLPAHDLFADEGAANHSRFCSDFGKRGIQLFVYGRKGDSKKGEMPSVYPARQTQEASESIARLHQLSPNQTLFAQQSPEAIDAGVFHNDVISVGHCHLFLYHELAFVESLSVIEEMRRKFATCCQQELILIPVAESNVSLADAVRTYLFNSQIVSLSDGTFLLLAPQECEENPIVRELLSSIASSTENPINAVEFCDIRESMQNGGGPACLRLRVVLNEKELAAAHQGVFLTEALYYKLVNWVKCHYRDSLSLEDLRDPSLCYESQKALDELTTLLGLGSLYSFQ